MGVPFATIEMDEVDMQDIISAMIFLGKLRIVSNCLIKDNSSLSKAFSRSILRRIFTNFPLVL